MLDVIYIMLDYGLRSNKILPHPITLFFSKSANVR